MKGGVANGPDGARCPVLRSALVASIGLLILLAGVFVDRSLLKPERASAHAVDTAWNELMDTPQQCILGLARIADGNYGKGFSRAYAASMRHNAFGHCGKQKPKAVGRLATAYGYYYKKNGSYIFCAGSNYVTNKTVTSALTIYRDFRHLPCGATNYRTIAYALAYVAEFGGWFGGQTTGYPHYFPAR